MIFDVRIQNLTLKSIIQWGISFVLLDLFFLICSVASCVSDPNLCYGANTYAIYYLYGFPLQLLDLFTGARSEWVSQITNAPIIGALTHIFIGVAVGYFKRRDTMPWSRTISVAVSALLLLSFVPALLLSVISLLFPR